MKEKKWQSAVFWWWPKCWNIDKNTTISCIVIVISKARLFDIGQHRSIKKKKKDIIFELIVYTFHPQPTRLVPTTAWKAHAADFEATDISTSYKNKDQIARNKVRSHRKKLVINSKYNTKKKVKKFDELTIHQMFVFWNQWYPTVCLCDNIGIAAAHYEWNTDQKKKKWPWKFGRNRGVNFGSE